MRRSGWDALFALRRRDGTALIFTTHHMEEAESYAGRVASTNRGRVVACGTPAELEQAVPGRRLGTMSLRH
ncbi:hypothetical protein [Thermomicrobium sp.]